MSLWQAGLDASLELKTFHGEASAHIHVGLGQAPCLQKTQPTPHRVLSPSCLRRRAWREEARRLPAEEGAQDVLAETAEKSEPTLDEAGKALRTSEAAVKVVEQVKETVYDEVCPNAEYFTQLEKSSKKKCSIQLFPVNQGDIDSFRDSVERVIDFLLVLGGMEITIQINIL